jgi:type II restriction enzyme
MSMTNKQKFDIQQVIINNLRNKFQNYNPEPASMPFHYRLLGKDRIALYSFIHSLSTNFGTSIFEPVAKSLAENLFSKFYIVL